MMRQIDRPEEDRESVESSVNPWSRNHGRHFSTQQVGELTAWNLGPDSPHPELMPQLAMSQDAVPLRAPRPTLIYALA